ncbi:vesicle-associated membrane protein 8-like [Parambassis ranga]|uniref:Vesicle-associated membrane protein 8-like n=1 Tax=Parambassis ranga TaxID=210632 RepID=A0A6P7J264_9TELE|nr:vesicle-associated membrane protein 8-like [Parambassis ranga]
MDQAGATAEPAPQSKLQYLSDQVQDVTNKMKENMEHVIERGEKAGNLLDRAETLSNTAEGLKKSAQKLETSYRCKNIKLIVVIVAIALVIILIIILLATGVIPVSAPLTSTVNPTSKP